MVLPPTISNLSSLAYGDDLIVNNHTANVYSVTENVEQINMINEYKKRLSVNKFSSQSIELRNNSNLSKSAFLKDERDDLIERYLNEK